LQFEQQHLLPSQAELQSEALKEVAAARQLDKPLFRRKKAKGPNPLSVMPKKKQDKQTTASAGGQQRQQRQSGGGDRQTAAAAAAAAVAGDQPAAKRKRPRRRGKSSGDNPDGIE
jgi:hypothetical protein